MEAAIEYLTPKDIAAMLKVSIKTVRNWESSRRVPGLVKINHLNRYRKTDIEKALLSGRFLLREKDIVR